MLTFSAIKTMKISILSCVLPAVPAAATNYRFPVTVIKCLISIETGREGPSGLLNLLQDKIVFPAVEFSLPPPSSDFPCLLHIVAGSFFRLSAMSASFIIFIILHIEISH